MIRNEADIAWKEILDFYFKDFICYCLPQLNELINWKKKWISLDKELQSITKGTASGKKLLDKLFKVYLKDGKEQWILIHIEVQGKKEEDFPKRMFTYGYRIYDKYMQPIVSCAILTDDKKDWRPCSYKVGLVGSYLSSEYLVIKLLDYQNNLKELNLSRNPFASIILVQLEALKSKLKPNEDRKQLKFALTRRLYEKGFGKTEIVNLYKFIDWVIGLPKPFELEYLNEVYKFEETKKMPYISKAEQFGKEKGIKEGMEIVAIRLLSNGAKPSFVKKITGLSLSKIKSLQSKKH
ncbi:MAG: hypothetical protein JO131_05010 [Gammaproteobacteria bacterium]|nr:hypothetical protein [Gammaproteobacteria bacterium]